MVRIAILVRSLNYGGAERQITTLATALDRTRFDVTVLSFYSGGQFESELAQAHVKVISLQKLGRWDLVSFFWRLLKTLRTIKPHLLLSYLDVPNVISVLLKPCLPSTKVLWGIRTAGIDSAHHDWLTSISLRLERLLARFADLVIVNSNAGFRHFSAKGYPVTRMVVVPNGIDTELFNMQPGSRAKIREEWHVSADAIVVGLVCRLEPAKGVETFLRAASQVNSQNRLTQFVCVGRGIESYQFNLRQLASELGIADRVLWVGSRTDMPDVYNGLDILVSASNNEGFSNVIAEAMASGVPCIVTNVGVSAWIVGNTGQVVKPGNAEELADAIVKWTATDLKLLGETARQRIVDNFSVFRLVENTERHMSQMVEPELLSVRAGEASE
jgi:glycosyltransferase involved in cell wall biosynthesis